MTIEKGLGERDIPALEEASAYVRKLLEEAYDLKDGEKVTVLTTVVKAIGEVQARLEALQSKNSGGFQVVDEKRNDRHKTVYPAISCCKAAFRDFKDIEERYPKKSRSRSNIYGSALKHGEKGVIALLLDNMHINGRQSFVTFAYLSKETGRNIDSIKRIIGDTQRPLQHTGWKYVMGGRDKVRIEKISNL